MKLHGPADRAGPVFLKIGRYRRLPICNRGRNVFEVRYIFVVCGVWFGRQQPWLSWSPSAQARSKDTFDIRYEVSLSNAEYKKLDRLEAHALDKADALFREAKFRQAGAEYETFLREYPRSIALPYVLLRKARCLHLDDKRHEAAQQYNDVVDYFPNDVEYAAAALYYQGKAYWDDGDEALALKSWARMAKDKQYRTHRLAAGAINKLADQLADQGQGETALSYFTNVAIDFRTSNREAAEHARAWVTRYLVQTAPNEPKLRKFFADARLSRVAKKMTDAELAKSVEYWNRIVSLVRQMDDFKSDQAELRKNYYDYWINLLGGKFPTDDTFQIGLANLIREGKNDSAEWARRLDAQFARGDTKDISRIIRWISVYGPVKAKTAEYYAKLDFGKMTNDQIVALVRALYDRAADPNLANRTLGQLNLSKMTDNDKGSLAGYLWHKRNEEWIMRLCQSMKDTERGQHDLLSYYHWTHNTKEGLPLADRLIKTEKYATDAMWKKAELLEWSKKYPEAIEVYRQSSNEPENYWRIAGCYEKMGKTDQAIRQLSEIESFFKSYSSRAALQIAVVYQRAKQKDKCVAAYRRVLTKYPQSQQSSTAHEELERMGITRIKGGVREGKTDEE